MRPLGIFTDPEELEMYPMRPRAIFFSPEFMDDDDDATIPIIPIFQRYSSKKPEAPDPVPSDPVPVPRKPKPVKPADAKTQLHRAFKPLLIQGYKPMATAESEAVKYGYHFDETLSTQDTYVYVSSTTGRPLIVHRGSVTAVDWLLEDTLILTGLINITSSPRIAQARRITALAKNKYNKHVDAFGHSLGGRVAEVSGADGHIMTYNKAVGFGDTMNQVNSNQIDYRQEKDVVSLMSELQPRKTKIRHITDAGIINSHTVKALPEIAPARS